MFAVADRWVWRRSYLFSMLNYCAVRSAASGCRFRFQNVMKQFRQIRQMPSAELLLEQFLLDWVIGRRRGVRGESRVPEVKDLLEGLNLSQ